MKVRGRSRSQCRIHSGTHLALHPDVTSRRRAKSNNCSIKIRTKKEIAMCKGNLFGDVKCDGILLGDVKCDGVVLADVKCDGVVLAD